MPDVYAVSDDYRKQLLADDRDAANELTRAYADVWQRLQERLTTLTGQIQAAQKRGEPVGQSWLFQQGRLSSLMQQVEGEISRLEPRIEGRITQAQQQAITMGQDAARQMTEASMGPPPPGAFVQWNRMPRSATIDLVGRLQNGSPLRALLDELGPDASQRIRSALIRGIATGQGPREIARGMQDALGGNLARALTIARTEPLRAYREASRRSYEANDDVVEGWIWHSALNRRTCAFCWAQHGTEHSLRERFASHPNCRCSALPSTKSWSSLGFSNVSETRSTPSHGSDLFRRQPEAVQLAVLGPSKYRAYANGEITLSDLVGFKRTRDWGRVGYERPLYEVLEGRRRAA